MCVCVSPSSYFVRYGGEESSLHFPARLTGVALAMEEVEKDVTLAPRALPTGPAEHHIHEALGTRREHHRRRLLGAVMVNLQRQA